MCHQTHAHVDSVSNCVTTHCHFAGMSSVWCISINVRCEFVPCNAVLLRGLPQDAVSVIEDHNLEFNPQNKVIEQPKTEDEAANDDVPMGLASDIVSEKEFLEKHKSSASCPDGDGVWFSSSTGNADGEVYYKAEKKHAVSKQVELFYFGDGGWEEGKAADDLLEDVSGSWLPFKFNTMDIRVVLLKKDLPDHLSNMEVVGKVITLDKLFMALSTVGEGDKKVSHHNIIKKPSTWEITPASSVVFMPKKELRWGMCFCSYMCDV